LRCPTLDIKLTIANNDFSKINSQAGSRLTPYKSDGGLHKDSMQSKSFGVQKKRKEGKACGSSNKFTELRIELCQPALFKYIADYRVLPR
jgi:hypothetical protein